MPAKKRKPRPAKPGDKPTRRDAERIEVENVNVPGYRTSVDAAKYRAMKKALLRVLPRKAPGFTQAEMFGSVVSHLPEALFPGGEKAGWWAKCVHLDLEAKGLVVRDPDAKPLRWRRLR
jgi:hypothetical protein